MKHTWFIGVVLTAILSSCQWRFGSWEQKYALNEDERILRYDRLVDEYVSLNSFSALHRMNTEFPRATRLLIEDVLAIGSVEEALIERRLREYYMDSTMQVLLDGVHSEYVDLSEEEEHIFSVFNQIKEHDADFRIPIVYTQVSGLNQSIVVGDSVLGISLDKYLGSDYPIYKKYYYNYQRRFMDRSRLVPDALYYYLTHEYPLPDDSVHTLLDRICNYGKMHWVIAQCRDIPLYEEVGMEDDQIEWYLKNEAEVWEIIHQKNLLESADMAMVRRLTRPRDGTPTFRNDAPDRIGIWIGLQIVKHYMESHSDMSIGELLVMTDYKKMLRESGYNPSVN